MDSRRSATSWRAGGVRRPRLFLKREDVQQLAGQSTVLLLPRQAAGTQGQLPSPFSHGALWQYQCPSARSSSPTPEHTLMHKQCMIVGVCE